MEVLKTTCAARQLTRAGRGRWREVAPGRADARLSGRLSPGYVYGTPSYMGAMGGVGAGVGGGAGGLVQLPQLQHAAAVAAANHLYEYQAAAAQGAAAYQQQYAAAGFDPYATAAGTYTTSSSPLKSMRFSPSSTKPHIGLQREPAGNYHCVYHFLFLLAVLL